MHEALKDGEGLSLPRMRFRAECVDENILIDDIQAGIE
jgi:hypothetical protein